MSAQNQSQELGGTTPGDSARVRRFAEGCIFDSPKKGACQGTQELGCRIGTLASDTRNSRHEYPLEKHLAD
jgi:hypothetical protein